MAGIVLASGAFTLDGSLNLPILITLVYLSSITGDLLGYAIGSKFGPIFIHSRRKKIKFTMVKIKHVRSFLHRWGWATIFFTRWLATPFGIPVNIASGMTKYPFWNFTVFVLLGEAIWTGMYIFAGRYFGANWSSILEYTSSVPAMLTAIATGIALVYLGIRLHRNTA